jgi:mannose-1-phosphate guanylyltransferase/phosphomannomutase
MKHAALIMAGGRSERMRAGGCETHKALRTIDGTPLLLRNLSTLFSFGFRDVWIAVNQYEEQLLRYIEDLGAFAADQHATLKILREEKPLGTIGAARLVAGLAKHLLVVNVDNVTDLDLRALFEFHLKNEAVLTVASHQEPFRIPFGQLGVSGAQVTAYMEKPLLTLTVSSGAYVLSRRAMVAISPNERVQAPDLINALLNANERVCCFHHQAWWIDINDEDSLARAETALKSRPSTIVAASA